MILKHAKSCLVRTFFYRVLIDFGNFDIWLLSCIRYIFFVFISVQELNLIWNSFSKYFSAISKVCAIKHEFFRVYLNGLNMIQFVLHSRHLPCNFTSHFTSMQWIISHNFLCQREFNFSFHNQIIIFFICKKEKNRKNILVKS